jgi:hypothetical protein
LVKPDSWDRADAVNLADADCRIGRHYGKAGTAHTQILSTVSVDLWPLW